MTQAFDIAYKIVQKLVSHGFIAYFAGGWVRDFLMNHPSDDIDIATDATTIDIERIFDKTIPVGIQFGIIIVVEDDHHFEIATFRKDHGYEDGRRPIGVEHATPQEDASRRDFTINGMFYDPIREKIFDFVGGQEDLKKNLIKAIGNPHQRFIEDRLRMIRAIRYSCRFHFSLDEETERAIIAHANSLFPSVAIERVWQEFLKMDKFGNFDKFLCRLHQVKLLETIFPALTDTTPQEISLRLKPLKLFPQEAPLIGKILELFPKNDLNDSLSLCDLLKISNQDKRFIMYFYKVKAVLIQLEENPRLIDNYELTYLYAHDYFSLCLSMLLTHASPEKNKKLHEFHNKKKEELKEAIFRVKTKTPVVTSKHLLNEGIRPGVVMGKLLKKAEMIAINENLNTPSLIIDQLKKGSQWPKS